MTGRCVASDMQNGVGNQEVSRSRLGIVLFGRFVVLACALMGLLAVPGSALAATKSIDGFIGGPAGVNTGGLFSQASDVAVYTGGDANPSNDKILVAEGNGNNNSRVQRLDRDGNFELVWGRDTVATGAPGDTGAGFEVCSAAVSGPANCKRSPAGSAPGEFNDPWALAVSQATGDVYVYDRDNGRVQQFTLSGALVRTWGTVGSGAGQLGATTSIQRVGIAVGPDAPHDVFVADPENRRVMQFQADGTFVRGWGHGVADGSDVFQVCVSVCQAGNTAGSNERFASNWPQDIAVDANAVVYASDGTDDGRVVRFDADLSATPPAALLDPLPSPDLLVAATTVGLDFDPQSGNLLVARDPASGPTVVQEVADPGTDLVGPPAPAVVDTHTFSDSGVVGGIGYSPSDGNVYLAVQALFGPPSGSFAYGGPCSVGSNLCAGLIALADGAAPVVASVGPGDVGSTMAEVSASLDARGGIARYRFEVSRDGVVWEPVGGGYVAGTGDRSVSAEVSGLEPATLYRLRLSVSKQSGISTFDQVNSGETTFLTDAAAPDVQTLGSANRTSTGVRLRGRVDPNGSDTTYRFEYGPAGGSFDHHVPVPDAAAGSGNVPRVVTYDLEGLQSGTAYQYRLVASNFVGVATGDTVAFRTSADDARSSAPGRAYELVSPTDKLSGVGVGSWYSGPGLVASVGNAAHDGERFAAHGTFGSVLIDGKYTWANDWALASRIAAGWQSSPVASRRAYGTQYLAFLIMVGASPDLSLMSWWSSGHTVSVFEQMEGWDGDELGPVLLLRDWPGAWEPFVALEDPRVNRTSGGGENAIAADGSVAVALGHHLGDVDDPSQDLGGMSIYVNDISAGLSDTFPGDGIRRPANVCTDGTVIPAAVDVAGEVKQSAQGCPLPMPGRSARIIGDQAVSAVNFERRPGVVSDDGDRLFFTSGSASSCSGTGALTSCPSQLYLWQRKPGGQAVVRWLSRTAVTAAAGAAEDQDASLMGPTFFEGASKDGDRVFFRSRSPLTADDRNGQSTPPPPGGITSGSPEPSSWDLFAYDLADGQDPTDGAQLTRITAGPNGTGDCNSGGVSEGALRHVSGDGSRVYFTCAAPLPGVDVAGNGTSTDPGGTRTSTDFSNLYLYDANRSGAARWRFIARLPRDSELGPCATTATGEGASLGPDTSSAPQVQVKSKSSNCVRGTADGLLVTFWTDGKLTADDPDATSGDVYAYDAVRDELTRISAPTDGVGGSYRCAPGGVSTALCYGDTGIGDVGAATLPRLGVASGVDGVPVAFFESRSRLLVADTDDAYDVYQWRAGELSLVSTGSSATDGAFYVGNDRSGLNVYFATRDRLTWQDADAVMDVYTARVNGGIPEPVHPPVCSVLADACQGPGAAPSPATAPSQVPVAPDNVSPVRRVAVGLGGLSRRALRRAARTGVLEVAVRVSGPAVVQVSARARVGGRPRRVAAGSAQADRAGRVRVRLRLSGMARRQLRSRGRLVVQLSAQVAGGRPDLRSLVLARGGRR